MPYACDGRGDYYRGDYYRGDYYRGDPFLGSIGKAIGGAFKGITKLGSAVLKSGVLPIPASGIVGGVLEKLTGPRQGQPGTRTEISLFPPRFERETFGPDVMQGPAGTLTPQGQFLPGCQVKGFRPNKSTYYRSVPGQPLAGVKIPKGSVCVKTRRLNVANPAALRRAIRRAQGFAKLSRRVLSFVSAKAPKGRPRFKARRR